MKQKAAADTAINQGHRLCFENEADGRWMEISGLNRLRKKKMREEKKSHIWLCLINKVPLNNPCQFDFCIILSALAAGDDATEQPEAENSLTCQFVSAVSAVASTWARL